MSMDVLSNSSTHTLSTPKKVIFDIAMQLGQIDKLDPNTALIYITNKIEKMKSKISPQEYLMAQESGKFRGHQLGSFWFLAHPMATDMPMDIATSFIGASLSAIAETDAIQEELFKKFVVFYTIRAIIGRKQSSYRQVVLIRCDYHYDTIIVDAAKNAGIKLMAIDGHKTSFEIDLEEQIVSTKAGYQQPWMHIPFAWETHNHPTGKDSYSWTFLHDEKLVTYTTGADWQIYDNTGKSIGITWISWHPDPIGEPGEEGVDGIGEYNTGPRGSNGPGYPSLFGKQ